MLISLSLDRANRNKELVAYAVSAITILTIYCGNRFFHIFGSLPFQAFWQNHFNDFLGGLLFPIYVNLLCLLLRHNPIIKTLLSALALEILCSVFWEAVAPMVLLYSTADLIDCFCYMLGGLTFWIIQCLYIRKCPFLSECDKE